MRVFRNPAIFVYIVLLLFANDAKCSASDSEPPADNSKTTPNANAKAIAITVKASHLRAFKLPRSISSLATSDPAVAEPVQLSPLEFQVVGKRPGKATITISDSEHKILSIETLVVPDSEKEPLPPLPTKLPHVQGPGDVINDRSGNQFMEEASTTPAMQTVGQQALYGAYGCVYHHLYAQADRWLQYGQVQGTVEYLKARDNPAYLSEILSLTASKRKEASVPVSSPDLQVLRALIVSRYGDENEALEMLKRVALNNPSYRSIEQLKVKIKTMELETSGLGWTFAGDVVQTGGKRNNFEKWKINKIPLKVYIPTDAAASKIAGYRAGDGQLMRAACEAWQKQSGGKIRFVYEPISSRADITCAWVSDQKEMEIEDAIGVCSLSIGSDSYIDHAKIKILTFTSSGRTSLPMDNQFRKDSIEETCIHEVGHALGLNHSASKNDIMYAYAVVPPIVSPTNRDTAVLNSLYLTNVYDLISAALDYMDSGNYKSAFAQMDKAILVKSNDAQTKDIICGYLANFAQCSMDQGDYTTALKILEKANAVLDTESDTSNTKLRVLKNMQYAYLQIGNVTGADTLVKQHPVLQTTTKNSASFLDKYGLSRESIPYYEQALAKAPGDEAIREKFCLLLVTVANDELIANNDREATSLLLRAKGMLSKRSSHQIIHKVFRALKNAYQKNEMYDLVDQASKEESDLEQ